jgi:prepilin-type N-terminal cleavage/methylation domain-containing protein
MNNRRAGFTLVETLIVVVLGAVVMGSIYQMVVIQEKTTRHQYALISTADNTQTALAVITNDLKEISARDGDIMAVDSTNITFRALRKAGIICRKSPTNDWVDVWEMGAPFALGDSVLIFMEGPNTSSPNDDTWLPTILASVGTGNCATNPMGVTNVRRLNVGGAPFTDVGLGSPVRSFVPAGYRLAESGEWGQLMRTENGVETAIIDGLSTAAEGGLRMRFFDSTGVAIPLGNLTARRNDIMRMQLKVTGKAVTSATATQGNRHRDSMVTQVYLRGNARGQ